MQLPVTLSLRPSRRLALLLIAAHGGAALTLVVISLDLWNRLPLLSFVILSLAWQLARLFGARRIVRLTLHKDGVLECLRHDGEIASMKVHPQTTVTPLLAVLLLSCGQRRGNEALALLPDALGSEDFRRLRLWLRWLAVKSGD